jgi:hypothetical protein
LKTILSKIGRYIYENISLGFIIILVSTRILNPSYNNNHSIRHAAEHGFIGIVDYLLRHNKVNPADSFNWANNSTTII